MEFHKQEINIKRSPGQIQIFSMVIKYLCYITAIKHTCRSLMRLEVVFLPVKNSSTTMLRIKGCIVNSCVRSSTISEAVNNRGFALMGRYLALVKRWQGEIQIMICKKSQMILISLGCTPLYIQFFFTLCPDQDIIAWVNDQSNTLTYPAWFQPITLLQCDWLKSGWVSCNACNWMAHLLTVRS